MVLVVAPAAARANGDPCSDILTISDICIPTQAKIPTSTSKELTTLLTNASHKGTWIKVALLTSPGDLGLIPQLFGKPQQYARFLGQEIFYTYDGILLVVMKNGYGVFHGRTPVKRELAALRSFPKPTSGDAAELMKASIGPVRRLAAIAGTPLPKPKSGSNDTRDRLVIAIAAVVLIALGAAAVEALRSRRRRA